MNYYYFLLLIPLTLLLFGFNYLLRKVSQPAINYIRLMLGVGGIILVWTHDSSQISGPGLMLTGIFLFAITREVVALKKYYSEKKSVQKL